MEVRFLVYALTFQAFSEKYLQHNLKKSLPLTRQ